MSMCLARSFFVALSCAISVFAFADAPKQINVPAGDLLPALEAIAKQADVELVFQPEQLKGLRTEGVNGLFSSQDAIKKLLEGTSLELRTDETTGAMMIGASGLPPAPAKSSSTLNVRGDTRLAQADPQPPSQIYRADGSQNSELEEIVVTGSHLRGVAAATNPARTLTRSEIEQSGRQSIESVLETLPQNFSGLRLGGAIASNSSALQGGNLEGAVGIDLRGLGPQSTLVLINGQRRAGALQGRVTDIASIPISLVDSLDIVTEGHSAIYGSDAVAGVVNVILRRSFDGLESQIRYSDSKYAGGSTLRLSQVAGREAARGGFVFAYDYARDRSFDVVPTGLIENPSAAGIIPQLIEISPHSRRHTLYGAGRFDITEDLEVFGDIQYTDGKNDFTQNYNFAGVFQIDTFNENNADQLDASAGARLRFGDSWSVEAAVNHSRVRTDRHTLNVFAGFPAPLDFEDRADLTMFSGLVNGALPELAGVRPHVALGAEIRREKLQIAQSGLVFTDPDRTVSSAFAELLVPFGEDGGSGLNRLDLSAAARYDDYSDFGDTFNPQVSAAWTPIKGLTLRAAYSTAFRAPALQDSNSDANFVFLTNVTDPDPSGVDIPALFVGGANPDAGPEDAETWSAGFSFVPPSLPRIRFYASYYSVRYKGRLDVPAYSLLDQRSVLLRGDLYGDLVDLTPTASQLQDFLTIDGRGIISSNSTGTAFDPQSQTLLAVFPNIIIFDNRLTNIAIQNVRGLDFGFSATVSRGALSFHSGIDGTYTIDHKRAIAATAPQFSLINDVGRPVDLRLRGYLGIERGPASASLFVNYLDGYGNSVSVPETEVRSWTTVDVTLGYRPVREHSAKLLGGWSASASAVNLLNRRPPRALGSTLGVAYDPTNTNPFGRIISLTVTKRW